MADWRGRMAALGSITADPIQPQHLMAVVDRLAADDAILTSDSGTIATWSARHFEIRGGREYYLSGNLATMAPGLPYAVAAQWAHPGRQFIAFVGDGGFGMLMAEFDTAFRYHLPVKVIINNNASLGQILWEQMVLGYPGVRRAVRAASDFAPWAETCGGRGIRVTRRGTSMPPWPRRSRSRARPRRRGRQPRRAPDAGKVSYEQAKAFVKAFLRGSRTRRRSPRTLFRDKLRERLSGSESLPMSAAAGIDRFVKDVEHGRFERAMSGPDRCRRGGHRHRDLAGARPGQLRQPDDVAAGRR